MSRKPGRAMATTKGANSLSIPRSQGTTRQDFTYKKLEGLSFAGTSFRQSLFIGAIVKNCHFREVNFDRCDFSGTTFVNCTFASCRFVPDEIRSCKVANCLFSKCDFRRIQWHGIITEDSKFNECDFRESSIRESEFIFCELSSCHLKRSSVTMNSFSRCKFYQVNFGDCTALFLFFMQCEFDSCRINAESIGYTYGLSNNNLASLAFIYLGRPQKKPPSAMLIDDLTTTYVSRKWYVGACVLELNFRRRMPLLSLRSLIHALNMTIEQQMLLDWDEIRFLVKVLEQLYVEERLPLAGLWEIFNILNRRAAATRTNNLLNMAAGADFAIRQLDNLLLTILDLTTATVVDTELQNGRFWLKLKLVHQPNQTLAQLIPSQLFKNFGARNISLVQAREGSWIEIWELGVNALTAIYVSLVVVNGVMSQLAKVIEKARRLARSASGRKQRKRQSLPVRRRNSEKSRLTQVAPVSTHAAATRVLRESIALAGIARIEAALKILSALPDDQLENLAAYAADRIETAGILRVPASDVRPADLKRQPAV
jgi:uncharacterized protein YjbI with pentapeptide repeats